MRISEGSDRKWKGVGGTRLGRTKGRKGASSVKEEIERLFTSSAVTVSVAAEVFDVSGAADGVDGLGAVIRNTPAGLEAALLLGRRAMVVGRERC